jgi:hypothetical protein
MNIREWCAANGIEISGQGRIPQAILSAFASGDVEGARRYVTGKRAQQGAPKRKYTRRTALERSLAVQKSIGTVRAWAAENGWKVASRGRVSHEILVAYRRAMTDIAEQAGTTPVMAEQAERALTPDERVDRLEKMLRSTGSHIDQHPELR